MIDTTDFKNGISIELDGTLFQIVEFQHIKPGKGGAFVRTKLKNMRTKAVLDKTFRAGEKVQDAFIQSKKMQYTYNVDSTYFFMDSETYEEVHISKDLLADNTKFLKEGMEISSLWHKTSIIGVTLPVFINLKIEHTEPGIKGDTAKASFKPATVETGATVLVPLFVNQTDTIKVDTRTGEYVERV